MEVKSHYILKRTVTWTQRDTQEPMVRVEYYKGWNNWTSKYEKAKLYLKLGNIKKVRTEMADIENTKYEILYITTTVQTIDDIIEKELLDL